MNIIALAPYSAKIIKSLSGIKKIELANIIVIGNKKRFLRVCEENNIESTFVIHDLEVENLIIQKAQEIYQASDLIICGEISMYYKKKLCNVLDNEEFQYLNIIDLPDLRHFLFVCNYNNYRNIDFEDKKKAILEASKFMNGIGIRKTNVAFVSNTNSKADALEANIIRMILNDTKHHDLLQYHQRVIKIYDSYKLFDLFNRESNLNIYKNNINLLVVKSIEVSRMFVDALSVFGNCKVGSLLTYKDKYIIEGDELKDEENILFSTLVISRVIKNQKNYSNKRQLALKAIE